MIWSTLSPLLTVICFIQKSTQDNLYDKMHFVEFGKHDKSKFHHAGWDHNSPVWLTRLMHNEGNNVSVGSYSPGWSQEKVWFAWNNGQSAFLESEYTKNKVEFLQHTTNGGISWVYRYQTYQQDLDWFKRVFGEPPLSFHIGRTPQGKKIYACRCFPQERENLMIGRYIEGQRGCIVHQDYKAHVVDHFEIMEVNLLGMTTGHVRTKTSTDYCGSPEACYF